MEETPQRINFLKSRSSAHACSAFITCFMVRRIKWSLLASTLVCAADPSGAFQLPHTVSCLQQRGRVLVTSMVGVANADGRRDFLVRGAQLGAGCALSLQPTRARAAPLPGESATDDVSQNLRKAAAKIPGMGPPDVAYPEVMLGRWEVRRVLADVDFPRGQQSADAALAEAMLERIGTTEAFSSRFIPGKNGVVADREYNIRSLVRASEGADVTAQWKASNPNVLTVSYPTGELREIKVTKRATTLDAKAQAAEWSEYSRIALLTTSGALEGRGDVPDISARCWRVRTVLHSMLRSLVTQSARCGFVATHQVSGLRVAAFASGKTDTPLQKRTRADGCGVGSKSLIPNMPRLSCSSTSYLQTARTHPWPP